MSVNELPVVVVGAGPVGLAAAAHLMEREAPVQVLEAGDRAGWSVLRWHHVRLFSRWAELVDPAAARLLARTGWVAPDADAYPTGAQWAGQYLQPVADVLGERVRYGARVVGVARRGRDRIVDSGRESAPFTVLVAGPDGREERLTARAVIDASGTWTMPNPVGGDGLAAIGERTAADRMTYHVPDLHDPAGRARYAGRRIAVVGNGHSALTALVAFAELAEQVPGTQVDWVLRRGQVGSAFGGGDADQLPARGALGQRAAAAVRAEHVRVVTGFRTEVVDRTEDAVVLTAEDGRTVGPVDEVVVLTGFRPDLTWLSEVRLDLDPALQAPRALAPLIDPNTHSCGTVYPHGARELAQPEPGLYLVGMKSYGRAPTFLAMTGYEQVRSVVAAIVGDHRAAGRVELVLPETGVCGGAGLYDELPTWGAGTPAADTSAADSTGCCGPAEPVTASSGAGAGPR